MKELEKLLTEDFNPVIFNNPIITEEKNKQVMKLDTDENENLNKDLENYKILSEYYKRIEEKLKEYRDKLSEELADKNVNSLKISNITVSYIPPAVRISINAENLKKLKNDYPKIYNKYTKITNVAAQVRIK